MKKIIDEMIARAEKNKDYELAGDIEKILSELYDERILTESSYHHNYSTPDDWISIPEELAKEIDRNSWAWRQLELWNYEPDEYSKYDIKINL